MLFIIGWFYNVHNNSGYCWFRFPLMIDCLKIKLFYLLTVGPPRRNQYGGKLQGHLAMSGGDLSLIQFWRSMTSILWEGSTSRLIHRCNSMSRMRMTQFMVKHGFKPRRINYQLFGIFLLSWLLLDHGVNHSTVPACQTTMLEPCIKTRRCRLEKWGQSNSHGKPC